MGKLDPISTEHYGGLEKAIKKEIQRAHFRKGLLGPLNWKLIKNYRCKWIGNFVPFLNQ